MIELRHLSKRYGDIEALSDLSVTLEDGQIYGLLGPNGAGKSTVMNIICGCLSASSGQVLIDGFDIYEEAAKAKRLIGYLPEQPPLYMDRTPREYLRFVAEAKGVKRQEVSAQVQKVLQLTQTQDVADRLIKHLSKGYRQRVGIAQALLGEPKFIILDEPTVGLDPKQIVEIRQLIKDLGKSRTIILSSHILSEVQAICQTILIISKGKLLACDRADKLEEHFAASSRVELSVEGSEEQLLACLESLGSIDHYELQKTGDLEFKLSITSPESNSSHLRRELSLAFAKAGLAILEMSSQRASLEDVFLELTGPSGEEADK